MGYKQNSKKHAFELFRASAVMMVVLAHFSSAAKGVPLEVRNALASVTYLGVPLFFIISGYLLSASFMSLSRSMETVSGAVRIFFFKRILRIYPAYFVSLVVLSVFAHTGVIDFVLHLLNIHNLFAGHNRSINAVYWTLAVEFQWYLVAPLLIALVVRSSAVVTLAVLAAMICLSLALRLFWLDAFYAGSIGFSELERLAEDQLSVHIFNFLIGILVYKWREVELLRRWWQVAILVLAIICLGYFFNGIMQDVSRHEAGLVFYKLLLLYLSLTLLGVLVHSLLKVRLGSIFYGVVFFVSTISYSLYIYHYPIVQFMKEFDLNWGVFFLLYMSSSLLISSISYFLVEAPFLRYSKGLGK